MIKLLFFSHAHHGSQVITGFYRLCNAFRVHLKIENHSKDSSYPDFRGVYLIVECNQKVLVYDMSDGYQYPDEIQWFLDRCDFYFKRSFSKEYNRCFFNDNPKIHPYGFNYQVTYKKNPLDGPYYKVLAKKLLQYPQNSNFLTEVFEGIPSYTKNPKILFSVRLWPQDSSLSPVLNRERSYINDCRITIVKSLKEKYQDNFVGGLYDNQIARELAPELIISPKLTSRKQYLKTMHQCDICIASMGLHESIGGKMGEYVAAAKSIVSEKLHYSIPGQFIDGINYLSFEQPNECIAQVDKLYNNHDLLYRMKVENAIYYQNYLKPEVLIANTLHVADIHIG